MFCNLSWKETVRGLYQNVRFTENSIDWFSVCPASSCCTFLDLTTSFRKKSYVAFCYIEKFYNSLNHLGSDLTCLIVKHN